MNQPLKVATARPGDMFQSNQLMRNVIMSLSTDLSAGVNC